MSAVRRAWIILLVILALELIPFMFLMAFARPGLVERLYGFDPSHWPAWLAALAIAIVYIAYSATAFPLLREHFLTFNLMKAVAVIFAIVTGTVEELYFRKLLMDWAAHHGVAAIGQVMVSGVVFGAAHGLWGLFARQWRMALGATIATDVLGLLLGVVYLAADRQVAPSIWAHMLINVGIEPWLILAAASGGQIAQFSRRSVIDSIVSK